LYFDSVQNQLNYFSGTAWNGMMYPIPYAMPAAEIDCRNSSYFTKTVAGDTTFTFTNAPSGVAYAFTLEVTHSSGVITWPASVKWSQNSAPALSVSRVHLFTFVTDDAGTSWRGSFLANFTS
jgi:hypothetical protein